MNSRNSSKENFPTMTSLENSCPHCGGSGLTKTERLELQQLSDEVVADLIPCPCVQLHHVRLERAMKDSGLENWNMFLEGVFEEALAFLTGWYVSEVRHYQKDFPVSSGQLRVRNFLLHLNKHKELGL
jgi:hypothetical protein